MSQQLENINEKWKATLKSWNSEAGSYYKQKEILPEGLTVEMSWQKS